MNVLVQDFIQKNISLAAFTSWQVGGPAQFFCLPKTIDQVQQAQAWAQTQRVGVTVLGGGSNVLISDQGVEGLVICLKYLSGVVDSVTIADRLRLSVLAGTGKSELLKIFIKQKLSPALFLAGIPGDVGGGVVMNAGVGEAMTPREFVEITDWIDVLRPDGHIERLQSNQLQWSYRHMHGWQPGIIVQVGLSWPMHIDEKILDKVRDANRVRLSKQPLDMPSCGSVFVNPQGHKAAQLIESCGLKGRQCGEAQVSLKHANFIVNLGNAKATDIWQLILDVQQAVKSKTGVELKTEVVQLGNW